MADSGIKSGSVNKAVSPGDWMTSVRLPAIALLSSWMVALVALQDEPWRVSLFVCAYAAVVAVFFACSRGQKTWDLLHPAPGLFLLILLYALSSALFAEAQETTYYGEPLIEGVYWRYYAACLLGVAGLAAGLYVGGLLRPARTVKSSHQSAENDALNRIMLRTVVVLCLLTFPWVFGKLNFLAVKAYREVALSVRVERLADEAAGIFEVLTVYLPVTLMLVVCVRFMRSVSAPLIARLTGAAIFLAYLATGFLAGERYTILFCGILVVVYQHYWVKPITPSAALVGGAFAYLLMNLIPIVRYTSDPLLMIQIFTDVVQRDGLDEFSLGKSNELLTATNLHRQIQGLMLGEAPYNYGLSILTDLLAWIPRLVYPNRPLPSSEQFVDVFYPGVRETGGGYGFFIIQEGYWALGLVGCFLFMALFGFLVERVHALAMRFRHLEFAILWYAAVYADLVMASVRSGIVGSFKAALLHSAPFILILFVYQFKQWRK